LWVQRYIIFIKTQKSETIIFTMKLK
jgi:hypothetical protein